MYIIKTLSSFIYLIKNCIYVLIYYNAYNLYSKNIYLPAETFPRSFCTHIRYSFITYCHNQVESRCSVFQKAPCLRSCEHFQPHALQQRWRTTERSCWKETLYYFRTTRGLLRPQVVDAVKEMRSHKNTSTTKSTISIFRALQIYWYTPNVFFYVFVTLLQLQQHRFLFPKNNVESCKVIIFDEFK